MADHFIAISKGKDGFKILEDLFWKCNAAEVRAEIE